jgi:hypothetical protein
MFFRAGGRNPGANDGRIDAPTTFKVVRSFCLGSVK